MYLQALLEDDELLELLNASPEDVAQGLLVLEALSINALWDFGIPFQQVCILSHYSINRGTGKGLITMVAISGPEFKVLFGVSI